VVIVWLGSNISSSPWPLKDRNLYRAGWAAASEQTDGRNDRARKHQTWMLGVPEYGLIIEFDMFHGKCSPGFGQEMSPNAAIRRLGDSYRRCRNREVGKVTR